MTSSKTELWRLRFMKVAPQIQKLSVTSQAMDWSEMAIARSSFINLHICAYILHLMCPVVVVYHGIRWPGMTNVRCNRPDSSLLS